MTARRSCIARQGTATLAQVALLGPLALVQDWYVDAGAPACPGGSGTQADPFCTIQAAVDAALDGDTIHIAPGTYFENVVIAKDLSLIGTGGQAVTLLDGMASGSVVQVSDALVSLTGLTLTNGVGTGGFGGGVRASSIAFGGDSPSVALTSCTVSGNTADLGGGLCVGGPVAEGYFTLQDCTVSGNVAGSGGGIAGSAVLLNSVLADNVAVHGVGGGLVLRPSACGGGTCHGQAMLVNSTVQDNVADGPGGGIFARGGGGLRDLTILNLTIVNSTVSGNSVAGEYGLAGGIYAFHASTYLYNVTLSRNTTMASGSGDVGGAYLSNGTIFNSILFGNDAVSLSGGAVVEHSLVEGGWPGIGNIDADPLFLDPLNGDYRLQSRSPCIDAGRNSDVPFGITTDLRGAPRFVDDPLTFDSGVGPGPVVDLGAFEYFTLLRSRNASGVPVPTGPTRSVP